jgi:L,D-peptidoglycan transpeptidase YkuD (ErfK/YbiS/YcfS/YnhG family)
MAAQATRADAIVAEVDMHRHLVRLRVLAGALDPCRGWLLAGPVAIRCALGRGGVRAAKREGDGATPLALLRLGPGFRRADRGPRPPTGLPLRPIGPRDGWCDAAADRNYDRPVRLPYPASAEAMRREDGLYDLVVTLGWNERPRVRGHGSAIFLHIARPRLLPTEGCIALDKAALRRLLAHVGPRTEIGVSRWVNGPVHRTRRCRPAHASPRKRSPW